MAANSTDDGPGGAVSLRSVGSLFVEGSEFVDNTSGLLTVGGAIYTIGTVAIERSLFANNRALEGTGGAIAISGSLTLMDSTVIGSSSSSSQFLDGSAITTYGELTLRGCTVTGSNTGGITANGLANISNSIVVGNTTY